VTEGSFRSDGVFVADSVLAKHDERYMPKEVAEGLKEKGVWQPD
jgi:cytochrome c-type biogenesis protein CcmE